MSEVQKIKDELINKVFEISKNTGVSWDSDEAIALIISDVFDHGMNFREKEIAKLKQQLDVLKEYISCKYNCKTKTHSEYVKCSCGADEALKEIGE